MHETEDCAAASDSERERQTTAAVNPGFFRRREARMRHRARVLERAKPASVAAVLLVSLDSAKVAHAPIDALRRGSFPAIRSAVSHSMWYRISASIDASSDCATRAEREVAARLERAMMSTAHA